MALLMLGMLHCLCVRMVAQLHALSAQQNEHLLRVEFSSRKHCSYSSVLKSSLYIWIYNQRRQSILECFWRVNNRQNVESLYFGLITSRRLATWDPGLLQQLG